MRLGFGKIMLKIFIALIFVVVIGSLVFAVIFAIHNEDNRISEGYIVDKDYTSAYITNTIVNGVIIPHYHSESYSLCISGEKDGEIVEYWFGCTAEEYAAYSVGDYFKM